MLIVSVICIAVCAFVYLCIFYYNKQKKKKEIIHKINLLNEQLTFIKKHKTDSNYPALLSTIKILGPLCFKLNDHSYKTYIKGGNFNDITLKDIYTGDIWGLWTQSCFFWSTTDETWKGNGWGWEEKDLKSNWYLRNFVYTQLFYPFVCNRIKGKIRELNQQLNEN